MYEQLLPEPEREALRLALQLPIPPAIRLNPLKSGPDTAETLAARYRWQLSPVPFAPSGYQVENGANTPLGGTLEHHNGVYYVQDAASMLPAMLFDFPPDAAPLILDMAAAPGGKTTHLLDRIADHGLVIANDSSTSRLSALRYNLHLWSASAWAMTNLPGERFGAAYPERFDAVLLDAPCSGENLTRETRAMSAKERAALTSRQINLLFSALSAVKVGGEVVYATCTLSPDENEAILDSALRQLRGKIALEDANPRLPMPAYALTQVGERAFDSAVRGAIRLYPHHYRTDGFFAAKFRKLAPLTADAEATEGYYREKNAVIGAKILTGIAAQLADYGFSLRPFLEDYQLEAQQYGQAIYAVPSLLRAHFPDLPVRASGLLLGEVVREEFIPSQELITRFPDQFQARRCTLTMDQVVPFLRGDTLRPFEGEGIFLVQDDEGRLLGRGKAASGRFRTLLPRR